jgi:hypothetical protein
MTDHQRFSTSAEFMRWVERIVKNGDQRYDRVPVGRQTWTYGDGHIEESEWGKRGGTVLSNLKIMHRGQAEHSRDKRIVSDIDTRGGMTLKIDWGE